MSSKLDKSMIIAGAGLVASIFTMLVKKVREAGGTDEDIHRLATPDGEDILNKVAEMIVSANRQTFKIMVDYGKTLAEMVAAGKYDWVDSDITAEHFPVQGEGKKEKEVAFFHFNRTITSDQVISEMDKAGYRPATIEELLVIGASQPELQRQFPIVAIGSVLRLSCGLRRVPCLDWDGLERDLDFHWFKNDWRDACRFVALRKS